MNRYRIKIIRYRKKVKGLSEEEIKWLRFDFNFSENKAVYLTENIIDATLFYNGADAEKIVDLFEQLTDKTPYLVKSTSSKIEYKVEKFWED